MVKFILGLINLLIVAVPGTIYVAFAITRDVCGFFADRLEGLLERINGYFDRLIDNAD